MSNNFFEEKWTRLEYYPNGAILMDYNNQYLVKLSSDSIGYLSKSGKQFDTIVKVKPYFQVLEPEHTRQSIDIQVTLKMVLHYLFVKYKRIEMPVSDEK